MVTPTTERDGLASGHPAEDLREMYRRLARIRQFEEAASVLY